MTRYYMNPRHFADWMEQNQGVYTGDFAEGTLLDNFIVALKNGWVAFYEHATTTWNSDYYCEWSMDCHEIYDSWYARIGDEAYE